MHDGTQRCTPLDSSHDGGIEFGGQSGLFGSNSGFEFRGQSGLFCQNLNHPNLNLKLFRSVSRPFSGTPEGSSWGASVCCNRGCDPCRSATSPTLRYVHPPNPCKVRTTCSNLASCMLTQQSCMMQAQSASESSIFSDWCKPPPPGLPGMCGGERIFIEPMTSDRQLKASREGSK